ncbi:hypothetical protein lbkm_2592 [Lachnospiraceae bacterium KM106-2]|nr:hypothetical protein lbkm_2592 [Lachnospiraceae bacterium KM106-2]
MESSTKNKQSFEKIQNMVLRAFGKDTYVDKSSITEMEGGFCNAVYEMKGKDRNVILKIGPAPETEMMSYEKELIETEVKAIQLIRERTKLSIPEVLYYDPSKTLCNSDYFFMTKIEGKCLENEKNKMPKESYGKLKEELGHWNRTMNDVEGTTFKIFSDDKEFTYNSDFINYLFQQLLEDARKKHTDLKYITYDELFEIVQDAKEYLDDVKQPHFVHWDLWEGNIFIKEDRVEGIIDFERALWGDPLMEFELSFEENLDPQFIKGYGRNFKSRSEEIRRLIYTLYRELGMIVESDYRNYEDNGAYRRWSVEVFGKTLERYRNYLLQLNQ